MRDGGKAYRQSAGLSEAPHYTFYIPSCPRTLAWTINYTTEALHDGVLCKIGKFITQSSVLSVFCSAGLLSWKHLISRNTMRWSLAAHDICFTNSFHSYFFMLGKCIPVIRGKGVYQVRFLGLVQLQIQEIISVH